MSKLKAFVYSLSILLGGTIGVGFLSLPYVTLKAGIWPTIGYFLILGTLTALIHLFFGELALKTPDYKRLPGFAKIYLGEWGKKVALVSIILGLFGTILAYLVVGGGFLRELLSPVFGGGTTAYTLFYFVAGAILIFFGIRAVARVEFLGIILFLFILLVIFLKNFSKIKLGNVFLATDFNQLFLPYGPILFSLWGATLIPEAEETLGEHKRLFKIIIPTAVLITILAYCFFIFLVLGIAGRETSPSALLGLKNFLSSKMYFLALVPGILMPFTCFIALGLNLKNIFHYDLKIRKNLAWLIACFVPLTLFLIGLRNFIPIVSFIGAIMLGIDGILILLMYRKIKTGFLRTLTYPLILVLLIGIIYEIIYFIK